MGSPDLHRRTHQSADGQERGRFQRRCVLSELNCKVDQRDADQHCSDDLTDRSNRFPVHLRTLIVRLTGHKLSRGSGRRKWHGDPIVCVAAVNEAKLRSPVRGPITPTLSSGKPMRNRSVESKRRTIGLWVLGDHRQ